MFFRPTFSGLAEYDLANGGPIQVPNTDDMQASIRPAVPTLCSYTMTSLGMAAPLHHSNRCTCGSSCMYSMVLSTATISCSVSAEVVSTPFRISVIDSA